MLEPLLGNPEKFWINTKMVPLKYYNFFHCAGCAAFFPYSQAFARQMGVTPGIFALVNATLPLARLLILPFLTGLIEKLQIQKPALLSLKAVYTMAIFSLIFIPDVKIPGRNEVPPGSTSFSPCPHSSKIDIQCNLKSVFLNDPPQQPILTCNGDNFSRCKVKSSHEHPLPLCDKLKTYAETANGGKLDVLLEESTTSSQFVCKINQGLNGNENEVHSQPVSDPNYIIYTYQFWWFVTAKHVYNLVANIVWCVIDALTYDLLGEAKSHFYGWTKVFCTMGWGLNAAITGELIDSNESARPTGAKVDYSYMFYLFCILQIISAIPMFMFKFPQHTNFKTKEHMTHNVWKLIGNRNVLTFLLFVLLIGTVGTDLDTFLFWYIQYDLGASHKIIGLSILCTSLSEIVSFLFAGIIVRKIGHDACISLTLAILGLRLLLYAWITNPWAVLPIGFLGGFTGGLFNTVVTSYASLIAPLEMSATMQSVIGATGSTALGGIIGNLIGSFLYESYGGRYMFHTFGMACIIAFIAHTIIYRFKLPRFLNKAHF